MTRKFLFASFAAAAALFTGAVLVDWMPLAFLPAAGLHVAALLFFGRSKRPRMTAYWPVIRTPAIVSVALLALAPLASFIGPWLQLPLGWAAVLTSLGVFHLEYQSIRECEHALREMR